MKYLALLVFALILSFSSNAQFDNEHFDFKRNTVRIGARTVIGSNFPIYFVDSESRQVLSKAFEYEFEFERQLSPYFSANVLYKFIDYDVRRYQYKEHQRQINVFYAPFNNLRRIQFKIGAGFTQSTINETIDPTTCSICHVSGSGPAWGIIGSSELNYSLLKNVSIGFKVFKQMTSRNGNPQGGMFKLGYSF